VQVPFALLATAYRRKRIMEGLISGDKDMTAQVGVAVGKGVGKGVGSRKRIRQG
jgi:hypothetical protein